MKNNNSIFDVTEYILKNVSHNMYGLMLIVGEYGSGKTSLLNYLFYKLCKQDEKRIPFYIPLGQLEQHQNYNVDLLKEDICKYININYNLRINSEDLDEIIKNKKLIFILDAFDEMANILDVEIANSNLKAIKELSKKSLVILTSRYTYISPVIKNSDYFELLEISEFGPTQITAFLGLKFKKNTVRASNVKAKLKDSKIKEIIIKPFFLDVYCSKFDEIKDLEYVNESVLFKIITKDWMMHDLSKTSINDELKSEKINLREQFSEIIALLEYKKNNSIDANTIKNKIREEFEWQDTELDSKIDQYTKDAQDCTFLTVVENNFKFNSRPFLEYFVAKKIIREISEYEKTQNAETLDLKLSKEIIQLVCAIAETEWVIKDYIAEMNENQENEEFIQSKMDQSENILKIIEDIQKTSRQKNEKKDVSNHLTIFNKLTTFPQNLDLSDLDIIKADLTHTSLIGVNFSNSNIIETNLSHSILHNSNLTNTEFVKSDLSYSELNKSQVETTTFESCILIASNLSKIQHIENNGLFSVVFKNSIMLMVNLSEAYIPKSDFTNSDLRIVNLSESTLNKAIMIKTNLEGANFSEATFYEVDFTNAKTNSNMETKNGAIDSKTFLTMPDEFQKIFLTQNPDLRKRFYIPDKNEIDLLDEVFDVDDHIALPFDLEQNSILNIKLDVRQPVTLFILNFQNYQLFENGENFDYFKKINFKRHGSLDIKIEKTDTWYIVFENMNNIPSGLGIRITKRTKQLGSE